MILGLKMKLVCGRAKVTQLVRVKLTLHPSSLET